jgi:P-type Ca2+ transporter type 2C
LLSIAAAISLALGLFQGFRPSRNPNDPPVDWVEGVAIMVAIGIIVSIVFTMSFQVTRHPILQLIVSSLNDWQKKRQIKAPCEQKYQRSVKVIRDGVEKMIDIKVFLLLSILSICPQFSFSYLKGSGCG